VEQAAYILGSGSITNGSNQMYGPVGFKYLVPLVRKNIICDGNSLTRGYPGSGTVSYPVALAALESTWVVGNLGADGLTTAQMESRAAVVADPTMDAGATMNVLVAWELTNSVAGGASAATVISDFHTYCANRKTANPTRKIVVLTMLPRGAPYEATRATINADIRDAGNVGVYWDAVADVAADPDLETINATYYNGDNLHLTTAGYAIVANLVRAAINSL
jgi:lysophospholipase L1-like esterase